MAISVFDFRNIIRAFCREQWQDHWSSLTSNFKLRSIRPSIQPWSHFQVDRRSSIVLTRLRIGHAHCTYTYLMASGVERQAPLCQSCQVVLTIEHILVQCPNLENKRRDNLLSNKSLENILNENAPLEQIVKFLKDVNIFYDI